jgi:hypothetical protein
MEVYFLLVSDSMSVNAKLFSDEVSQITQITQSKRSFLNVVSSKLMAFV